MNPFQCAIGEFQRHESVGRERTGQIAGFFGREAEARIVLSVSEHDDDTFTLFAKFIQTAANQPTSYQVALMFRQNRHRS